jgi:L-threonylcarbamoyladenylate synthase
MQKDKQLVEYLMGEGVAIIPTDTTYGLVCRASDPSAIAQMFQIKDRDNKPGTYVAANTEQVERLGVDRVLVVSAKKYWPGPISVVFGEKAVRIPDDQFLLELCSAVGPLMTTSANMPGQPVANTIDQARDIFGAKIGYYIDGGDLSGRLPSTIIRLDQSGKVEIIRQGAGTITDQQTL